MAASIRSLVNNASPVDNGSREDAFEGDVISLESLDLSSSTFVWELVYKPTNKEGVPSSASILQGLPSDPFATFVVDMEGSYLVQLTLNEGTPSESSQTIRVRALTVRSNMRLMGAGETYNDYAPLPVDIGPTGWADDLNRTLLTLEARGGGTIRKRIRAGETLVLETDDQYIVHGELIVDGVIDNQDGEIVIL